MRGNNKSKLDVYNDRAIRWLHIAWFLFWTVFAERMVACYEWFCEHDIILSFIFWIFVVIYLLSFLYGNKREKKVVRDVIYYDPPKDFTPAEVAVIDTWWPTWRVFPAMLYDWVAKKYVRMLRLKSWEICFEKIVDDPIFRSDAKYINAYYSAYNRDPEHDFWEMCFINRTRVSVRMLMRIPWIDKIPNDFFYQAQRQCLDWKEYKTGSRNPLTVAWEKALLIPICIWCLILWFCLSLLLLVLISIALFIRIMSLYYVDKEKDKSYYLNSWGVKALEQIKWFKKYLLAVEDNKLRLMLKEDPTYFEKILPYAIAMWIWDGWLDKVFIHLQYDSFGWTIPTSQTSGFRTNPDDLLKLRDWIANSISFFLLYKEVSKKWWSLSDALAQHEAKKQSFFYKKLTLSWLFNYYATHYSNSRYSRANWYGWHAKK